MSSNEALGLSFSEVANLRTFEDLRRYAKWPEDVQPIPMLAVPGIDPRENIKTSYCAIIEKTARSSITLQRIFDELEENKHYINIDNFKLYLALRGTYEMWLRLQPFPRNITDSSIIPEARRVRLQVKECAKLAAINYDIAHRAFNLPEQAHPIVGYTSSILCRTLDDYKAKAFRSNLGVATQFAWILAPPGMGKTFAVSQLALKHQKYVIYFNFAPERHCSYPRRSPYASMIQKHLKGKSPLEMKEIWKVVIEAFLRLAKSAYAFRTNHGDFFHIQSNDKYHARQQEMIATALEPVLRSKYINWAKFDEACQELLHQYTKVLSPPKFRQTQSSPDLRYIICFDGVKGLVTGDMTDESNMPIYTLQEVLSTLCYDDSSCFALFLGTSSQLPNDGQVSFRPSVQQISSKAFPPYIWFKANVQASEAPCSLETPNTSWEKLLTFGQPLWTALLQGGSTVSHIMALASQRCNPTVAPKFRWCDPMESAPVGDPDIELGLLALLSYRIPFNISNFALAEKLASDWMYKIVDISEERKQLLVSQPSEPILAHMAYHHGMRMGPHLLTALACLNSFLYQRCISIEDMDEFITGLVLLLSFDDAMLKNINPGELPTKPIVTRIFLSSLLGENIPAELMKLSHEPSQLEEILSLGQVFFNRLYRRKSMPSQSDVYNMYRSCAACYLPNSSEGAAILIPIWIPKSNGGTEGSMGCILVQVEGHTKSPLASQRKPVYDEINTAITKLSLGGNVPIICLAISLDRHGSGNSNGTVVLQSPRDGSEKLGLVQVSGLDAYPLFKGPLRDANTSEESSTNEAVLSVLQVMASQGNRPHLSQSEKPHLYEAFDAEFLPYI
ncbi:hypothetical protein HOO65_080431 [Ceratocystis lukuohia]|uniref:Uncharacterized protein n=1 Tax=Ceratocystis lukuohia TaxID=2019550 RepID=A0ABR4MB35_9PEZI